jgi:hypothetical protein
MAEKLPRNDLEMKNKWLRIKMKILFKIVNDHSLFAINKQFVTRFSKTILSQ